MCFMNYEEVKVGPTYSTQSSVDLINLVLSEYNLRAPIACDFWARGFNDTYKVTTEDRNYSLRVYRHDWRSLQEVEFEIEALVHLKVAGFDVAYPIERRDGGFITVIRAPEGIRYATLTRWVEGLPLDYDVEGSAARFGKSVARAHALSAEFQSRNFRRQLDLDYLLHRPVQSIKKFISRREDVVSIFESYESSLSETVRQFSVQGLDFGFCHGDFHGFNAHDSAGVITHFDFDFCGYGHRAYDLATYKWSARLCKKENERWPQFLEAYATERKLSEADLALINPYIAIRDIWLLGVHIDDARYMGYGWLNDKYIDQRLEFLRKCFDEAS